MRYIHGERVFWGREILKSDLFLAYLSFTVTTMLLVYNKDLALNTLCLLTFRFWVLWTEQFCRNLIVYQWDKMCFMLAPLQLQNSEQKPLWYPMSNHLVFIYSFTSHGLFLVIFGENLWKSPEKILKASNTEQVALHLSPTSRTPHKMANSSLPSMEVGWKFDLSP